MQSGIKRRAWSIAIAIVGYFALFGCPAPINLPPPSQIPDDQRLTSEPKDDVAFIYDQAKLRTFELQLTPENLAFLDADPTAEKYVKGKLLFEGKVYEPVGIRYKGSVGGWVLCTGHSTPDNPLKVGGPKTCPKLNLKVSFNEYDSKGRFFGVKKLLFHAMNLDSSLMRERLGYWLFRQMKVPAPRAVHVKLLINGALAGLFINVEYIDGRFTRSRFTDGKGNLYKEIWPTAGPLQPALTKQRWRSGLRTNEDDNPSFQNMLDFGRAVSTQSGEARAKAIEAWMSVDNTMRYIAVDRTIGADDGPFHFYCSKDKCRNHNFYVYEEHNHKRIWLIPWDLDNAFVIPNGSGADRFLHVVHPWDDQSVVCKPHHVGTGPAQMPPSCDPLFRGLAFSFQESYRKSLRELLHGPFDAKVVEKQLSTWKEQIAKLVSEAHQSNAAQLSPREWDAGLLDLRRRIKLLRDQATQKLAP